MDPALLQSALTLIRERRTPLICLPKNASSDAVAAGLGLFLALEKMGKRPKVVSPGFTLPPSHGFLPKSEAIETDIAALRKFIITVNTQNAPLEELSYDLVGNQAQIYLTPRSGFYDPKDITMSTGTFTYDVIIVLDAPALTSLGPLVENNREFFYHTPVINIDHAAANERYGQVALVETTASSTAEIVFELLEHSKESVLDEYIATALLTGMISKTQSFRTPNVTPRSLAIASHLIASGARREEIIKNLFQTKSLAVLKLWGRALTRLQSSMNQRFVWTTITHEDLVESGATLNDVPGVIDELIANTAGAQVILVAASTKADTQVFLSTSRAVNAAEVLAAFSPTGGRQFASATVANRPLQDVVNEVRGTVELALKHST